MTNRLEDKMSTNANLLEMLSKVKLSAVHVSLSNH